MITSSRGVGKRGALSRGTALVGALLATLATPTTWPLALAVFLIRGGFVLVLLPIVVLPSPVGLGNVLAPALTSVAFRGVSVELIAGVGLLLLAVTVWVVIGGLVAAVIEAEAIRIAVAAADKEEEEAPGTGGSESGAGDPGREAASPALRVAVRILVARTLAHVPTVVALTWGSVNLIALAYRELTSPIDVATPIVIRVLRAAPEVVTVVLGVWGLGEIIGGMAARRVVLRGAGVPPALRGALMALVRNPVDVLVAFLVPTLALVLVVAPAVLAAASAWAIVRVALRPGTEPLGAVVAVVLFVAVWLVGLALISVTCAWRAAVWSLGESGAVPPSRRGFAAPAVQDVPGPPG